MTWVSYLWLGVAILAAVVEAAVPSLVSVWFVPGGLVALVASLLGGPVWLQVLLFLGVSGAALALTRPLARRLMDRRQEHTNADRAVGAVALVTQDIDNVLGTGRAAVLGNSWSARSVTEEKIPAGSRVRVERIEGVKLMVSHLEQSQEEGEDAL